MEGRIEAHQPVSVPNFASGDIAVAASASVAYIAGLMGWRFVVSGYARGNPHRAPASRPAPVRPCTLERNWSTTLCAMPQVSIPRCETSAIWARSVHGPPWQSEQSGAPSFPLLRLPERPCRSRRLIGMTRNAGGFGMFAGAELSCDSWRVSQVSAACALSPVSPLLMAGSTFRGVAALLGPVTPASRPRNRTEPWLKE